MPGRPSPSIQRTSGGVTVGINVGIAEVGITTDYGGGGKIGFGGQSITWGLEGGKIQMGIAGFELIVEARNCVVTETKKIAGMVVATRTYPDPGCEKEEKEQKQPVQRPPSSPNGKPLEKICENGKYVLATVFDKSLQGAGWYYPLWALPQGQTSDYWILRIDEAIQFMNANYGPPADFILGFDNYFTNWNNRTQQEGWNKKTFTMPGYNGGNIYNGQYYLGAWYWVNEANPIPRKISGAGGEIRRFALIEMSYSRELYFYKNAPMIIGNHFGAGASVDVQWKIIDVLPPPECPYVPPKPNPVEGGNRPPMNSSCCKEILADLEDLKEVFAVEEMLKGECSFPWRLRMPGGQGEEKIYDYANYLRALAQEMDHLGIHPPKLFIKDNNNAQEGDQTVDIKFPSATSAFEALMKQVWDDNADGDTRTNFLYRLAWLAIQNQEATIKLSAKIHAIADALGIELEVDTAKFPVPFNVGAGIEKKSTRGQGFGKPQPQIDSRIDINSELATESLLPQFLKCRENEVLIERFSGDKDIMDMLSLILLHVEKLNSK